MTSKDTIKTENGEVIDGNVNPTKKPGKSVEVKPTDEEGRPIQGANVTLECGDPPRSYIGDEQEEGLYIFKDAVPQNGQEECKMTVEADG